MTEAVSAAQSHRDESQLHANELDALLRQSALGDSTAFGTLYDRTATKFYQLALAVLGDHPGAEETTRAAYAQIWASSRDFDATRQRPLSWMTTIVYELARTARSARTA